MNVFEILSKKLSTLSSDIELKEVSHQHKYINNTSADDLLNIPLVGGLAYIFYKYRQAIYVRRQLKKKYNSQLALREEIQEANKARAILRRQIEEKLHETNVSTFEVPIKYLHDFLKVTEEYPTVKFLPQGGTTYLMISQDSSLDSLGGEDIDKLL